MILIEFHDKLGRKELFLAINCYKSAIFSRNTANSIDFYWSTIDGKSSIFALFVPILDNIPQNMPEIRHKCLIFGHIFLKSGINGAIFSGNSWCSTGENVSKSREISRFLGKIDTFLAIIAPNCAKYTIICSKSMIFPGFPSIFVGYLSTKICPNPTKMWDFRAFLSHNCWKWALFVPFWAEKRQFGDIFAGTSPAKILKYYPKYLLFLRFVPHFWEKYLIFHEILLILAINR